MYYIGLSASGALNTTETYSIQSMLPAAYWPANRTSISGGVAMGYVDHGGTLSFRMTIASTSGFTFSGIGFRVNA